MIPLATAGVRFNLAYVLSGLAATAKPRRSWTDFVKAGWMILQ